MLSPHIGITQMPSTAEWIGTRWSNHCVDTLWNSAQPKNAQAVTATDTTWVYHTDVTLSRKSPRRKSIFYVIPFLNIQCSSQVKHAIIISSQTVVILGVTTVPLGTVTERDMSGLGGFGKVLVFFFNIYFIYLAMLGLSCSMRILSCGMWDLVPSPGIKPRPSVLGAWSLNHWTTREVPWGSVS